ncbi:hypothetical protein ACS0VU_15955, partial [Aliiroseovarius sp. KMU-71]|uniref:hypothetical protein n=1 Tax=Aliiroseovarius sp. KMU-71 TaxID=3453123 RepID=UPI003F466A1C
LLSLQWQLGLAPMDFWAEQFRTEKGYSSILAGSALIEGCRSKGPFDPTNVRGRGLWKEGDRVIANLGDDLPDDLQCHYLCFSPIPVEPCEDFDAKRLQELIQHFNFRDQGNAAMLFGWLSTALIGGALDWRPHGFLFGPPNTGKTTLHNLVAGLLTPMVVAADGQSTEPGGHAGPLHPSGAWWGPGARRAGSGLSGQERVLTGRARGGRGSRSGG